jgi:hypothetical protein
VATFYLDFDGGNDANNGTTFAVEDDHVRRYGCAHRAG